MTLSLVVVWMRFARAASILAFSRSLTQEKCNVIVVLESEEIKEGQESKYFGRTDKV